MKPFPWNKFLIIEDWDEEDKLSIRDRIGHDNGVKILEDVINHPDLSIKDRLKYDKGKDFDEDLRLIHQQVRHREHFFGDDWYEPPIDEYYHKLKELD